MFLEPLLRSNATLIKVFTGHSGRGFLVEEWPNGNRILRIWARLTDTIKITASKRLVRDENSNNRWHSERLAYWHIYVWTLRRRLLPRCSACSNMKYPAIYVVCYRWFEMFCHVLKYGKWMMTTLLQCFQNNWKMNLLWSMRLSKGCHVQEKIMKFGSCFFLGNSMNLP